MQEECFSNYRIELIIPPSRGQAPYRPSDCVLMIKFLRAKEILQLIDNRGNYSCNV